MSEDINNIVTAIDGIEGVGTTEELSQLQSLADRYFCAPEAAERLGVWFRFYERFPEDDGCGVFWSILHGIEAQRGYESRLVESIRRRPASFTVLLVNRLLNGGIRAVGDVDLFQLLATVATDTSCSPGARDDAQRFLDHQRKKAEPGATPGSTN